MSLAGLREAFESLTRPPLITAVLAVLLAAFLLVAVRNVAGTTGPAHPDGTMCCGDFTAFWTGGWLVASGQGSQLYDLELQVAYQAGLVPDNRGHFQPYNYPPTLALVMAPLALGGYPAAFAAFGLLSSAVLALGLAAVWPHLEDWSPVAKASAAMAVLAYHPVIATALGGQTSALTLGLFCAHYGAVRSQRWWLAGAVLGLIAYKPQFTLVLALWHLWRRDVRVLAAAFAVGAAQAVAGALVVGPDWPWQFLEAVGKLSASASWASEGGLFLSFPGALRWTFGDAGRWVGWGCAAVVWGVLARAGRRVGLDHPEFPSFYAMLVLTTIIGGPYAMFYDNALVALPVLLLVARAGESLGAGARLALAAAWFAFPLYALGPDLGLQPLFVEMVAVFAWAAARTWDPRR